MLYKRLKAFAGPAKYDFKDPDTGRYFEAPTRKELVLQIINYREQNTLPLIEHLNLVLESYWCSEPINCLACEEAPLQRTFKQYVKGALSLFKMIGFKQIVSKEKAEKRASVCVKCPHNVFYGEDKDIPKFQKWTDNIALECVEGLKVSCHERLGMCEICSCVLKAKVWSGEKIVNDKEVYDSFPDNCFQKIEGTYK